MCTFLLSRVCGSHSELSRPLKSAPPVLCRRSQRDLLCSPVRVTSMARRQHSDVASLHQCSDRTRTRSVWSWPPGDVDNKSISTETSRVSIVTSLGRNSSVQLNYTGNFLCLHVQNKRSHKNTLFQNEQTEFGAQRVSAGGAVTAFGGWERAGTGFTRRHPVSTPRTQAAFL